LSAVKFVPAEFTGDPVARYASSVVAPVYVTWAWAGCMKASMMAKNSV
jgi:hypothetical protein